MSYLCQTTAGALSIDRTVLCTAVYPAGAYTGEGRVGLVVLVHGLLAGYDGRDALEAGLLDHVVQRRVRLIKEGPHEGDSFGQVGE